MYFYDASVETDGESERAVGGFGAKGDGRRRGGEFGKFADEAAFFIFALRPCFASAEQWLNR